MSMIETFRAAFAPAHAFLAEDFASYHRRVITRMIEKHEGKLHGIGYQHPDYGTVRESYSYIKFAGNSLGDLATGVNEPWLAKRADEYATGTIESFVAKLVKKLAVLENVEVKRANGATYVITGEWQGKRVMVEQQQIFKVSNRGTPFHQWPARIYVDGKFYSEAAFKKMQEAAAA